MEIGSGLESVHKSILSELGVIYARYRHAVLLKHITSFSTRLNISKLIRVCDAQRHWKELTYLYTLYDNFNYAAATVMNHSPEAWDHMQFKDIIVSESLHLFHLIVLSTFKIQIIFPFSFRDSNWNQAFNFSSDLGFLASCIKKTKVKRWSHGCIC